MSFVVILSKLKPDQQPTPKVVAASWKRGKVCPRGGSVFTQISPIRLRQALPTRESQSSSLASASAFSTGLVSVISSPVSAVDRYATNGFSGSKDSAKCPKATENLRKRSRKRMRLGFNQSDRHGLIDLGSFMRFLQ